MLAPTLVTPPTTQPVTLAEAKAHLRVEVGDSDALIEGMIATAVAHLDGFAGSLGRALCLQTWSQEYDCFSGDFVLPFGPVQSVTTVAYGDGETFSDFRLLQDGRGWFLTPNEDASWPNDDGPVVVTFVAGESEVPAPLKTAILLHVATLYENRETLADKAAPTMVYEALVAPYRVWNA